MSRKIIYLVNPISGTIKKEILLKKIEKRTALQNILYEILPTRADGDYFFLKEKISNDGVTDVIVCGGDGTVNQVAGALMNEDVNIGIIPMGSGNGLAFAAKIPKQIDKALEIIFSNNATPIDAFFINNIFSCMLCGLGFDAQVAHDFSLQKKRGLGTYIKQTFLNFIRMRHWPFEITNKGVSFRASAYLISIANSNQFGNQFTIAPKASLHDGLLDIVIVKKMAKLKFLWLVLQQVRNGKIAEFENKDFHKPGILYFQTSRLMIYNPEMAPLHIDGDPSVSSKNFSIEIIPRAFKLLQPK